MVWKLALDAIAVVVGFIGVTVKRHGFLASVAVILRKKRRSE